jgi:hypothetical protein
MNTKLILRITAGVAAFYGVGHSSGYPWTPALGAVEKPIVEAMQNHSFDVSSFERSYWDFYVGFGILVGVALIAFAVLIWQLSAHVRSSPAVVRPLLVSLIVLYIVNAVMGWIYFFSIPAVTSMLVVVGLIIAYAGMRMKTKDPN